MVVISWSDHRANRHDTGFSNDAPPKISKPCHRVTVVGAERSIQLSYDRICMKNAVTAYFNLVK